MAVWWAFHRDTGFGEEALVLVALVFAGALALSLALGLRHYRTATVILFGVVWGSVIFIFSGPFARFDSYWEETKFLASLRDGNGNGPILVYGVYPLELGGDHSQWKKLPPGQINQARILLYVGGQVELFVKLEDLVVRARQLPERAGSDQPRLRRAPAS